MTLPSRYKALNKTFNDGGMSFAGLYRDEHLERDVIIKNLQPGIDQKRLLDEIRALSSIRSKHVVELYDVVKDSLGNIYAVVEEFIPGNDLNSKVGKVDAHEALTIGLSIASGLCDIHGHGQIHRDIKPNNMKFDAEGCIKIFDFGLAREDKDAATTGLIGTFGYAAPELCVSAGQQIKFTRAVDVFAFASVMLKLVRGKIPRGLKQVPANLPCAEADFHSQPTKLPKPICDLLAKCHSANPADRPDIIEVRKLFSTYLLEDQHRAALVVGSTLHTLHSGNRIVNVSAGSMGKFTIEYDGLRFQITATSGSIFVNNQSIVLPATLPGSCVVTMGPPSAGMSRVYVPVDVSHPEVIT